MTLAEVREWADRLDNPDFHIGLADRGAVAHILRKLSDALRDEKLAREQDAAKLRELGIREHGLRQQLRVVIRQVEALEAEQEGDG